MHAHSKLLEQPSLFQNCVGSMSRFDFTIHGKANFCDRAELNFVIPLALLLKAASGLEQKDFQLRSITLHQATSR